MKPYRLENATLETLEIATEIANCWEKHIDPKFEGTSPEELEMFVSTRADLVGHSLLLYPEGETAAQGFIGLLADPGREKYWTEIAVMPGSGYMESAVGEIIKQAVSINPNWNLQPNVNDLDIEQVRAWESRGFEKIQTSYAMKKLELSGTFPELPHGASMRTLSSEEDWKSMHSLQQDAFEHHFGFAPRTLKDFKDFRLDSETFDPNGIHILTLAGEDVGYVEVNDEIASLNQGYIQGIGVKHSHQKTGLGKILLQWGFSYCASRGFDAVELYVDIENKSGALRFYESAGMVAERTYNIYEKADWASK
jgi:ribosomal protein S18 acetylase RimI-like enzyme